MRSQNGGARESDIIFIGVCGLCKGLRVNVRRRRGDGPVNSLTCSHMPFSVIPAPFLSSDRFFPDKCQALTLFGLQFLDTILPVDYVARMINDEIIAMSSTLFGIENLTFDLIGRCVLTFG